MKDDASLFCTFRTAGRLYGVPVLDVKEVTAETRTIRIPHAPAEVLGLVNIRGHVFLALNLAALLALKDHPLPTDSQLVIFKPTVGANFGIIVDQIGDIVRVTSDRIEPFSADQRAGLDHNDRGTFVSSVCKLEDQLLLILDPRKFLPCIEQAIR